MYEQILRSPVRPFRSIPDAGFYFAHQSVEAARKTVSRAIERAEGPVVVMGGAGLGKSLLAEVLADQFQQTFDVVRLQSARLCSCTALLQNILFELDMPYRDQTEGELRLSLLDRLEPAEGVAGEGLLLLVDEAQTLSRKLLEELRLITDHARRGTSRTRLVLFGSMQLEDTFACPELETFNQRLAARCYLTPMSRDETMAYVNHQFSSLGIRPGQFVTNDALEAIYLASEGVPRLINQVVDHALILGAASGAGQLDGRVIEEAWSDLQQLPLPWASSASSGEPETNPTGNAIEFGELVEDDERLPETTSAGQSTRQPVADQRTDDGASESCTPSTPDLEFQQADFVVSNVSPVLMPEEHIFGPAVDYHDSGDQQDRSLLVGLETGRGDGIGATADNSTHPLQAYGSEDPTEPETTAAAAPFETEDDVVEPQKHNFFAAFAEPEDGELPEFEQPQVEDERKFVVVDDDILAVSENETSDEGDTGIESLMIVASDQFAPDTKDAFFADRPTDEKLLAFEEEQIEFEAMGMWENDPPLLTLETEIVIDQAPAPAEHSATARRNDQNATPENTVHEESAPVVHSSKSASAIELFGDDFDEEIRIPENANSLDPAAGRQPVVAADRIVETTRPVVASDVEVPSGSESGAAGTSDRPQPAAEEASEVESPVDDSSLDPWTVEISAVGFDQELAVHSEIEELVSQLNFQGVQEDFSVEQINIDAKSNGNSVANKSEIPTRQPVTEVSSLYQMHAAEQDAEPELMKYDDDRDLLIIEEDVVLSEEDFAQPVSSQPKVVRPNYTQLFSRLRK